MRLKVLPPDHVDIGDSLSTIGEIYEKLHNPMLAFTYYQQALAIYRKCLTVWHGKIRSMEWNIERLSEQLEIELDELN
ncbi:unnamed protein product [Rotaria sp. Silwood1]|nr:unnamed protein product [Rotaria sp. Silwood1]